MTDFPTFEDILEPKLRAWNRLNMIFNIKQLIDDSVATEYVKQFDRADQVAIYVLGNHIVIKGYENTRREIFRSLNAAT